MPLISPEVSLCAYTANSKKLCQLVCQTHEAGNLHANFGDVYHERMDGWGDSQTQASLNHHSHKRCVIINLLLQKCSQLVTILRLCKMLPKKKMLIKFIQACDNQLSRWMITLLQGARISSKFNLY